MYSYFEKNIFLHYWSTCLKAIDFESLLCTFRMKRLKECLAKPDSISYHIPNIFKTSVALNLCQNLILILFKIPYFFLETNTAVLGNYIYP